MRAVFYVYVCLLLFCAGRMMYTGACNIGASSSSTHSPVKKQHVKLNNSVPADTLLDDADVDTDDDYLRDLDEDAGPHRFLSLHATMAHGGFLTLSADLLSIHYNKRFKILPHFCGNSAPIYIRQRVLRV